MADETKAGAKASGGALDPRDTSDDANTTLPAAGSKPSEGELGRTLAGDAFAAKVDTLFQNSFVGTAMANHVELWNMVHAFKEDVKKLAAESAGKS